MRLFGHPVHPILVAFPIGLLGLTPILDGLARIGVAPYAVGAAYLCELAGLVGGGLAVVTGFADFMKIPQAAAATAKIAIIHASLALLMLSLFGVAFALRGGPAATTVPPAALALEVVGAVSLGVVGWFGGHLVFGHGVGVDRQSSSPAEAAPRGRH